MSKRNFTDAPILNSPYKEPSEHWRLNDKGLPTGDTDTGRRPSSKLVFIPGKGKEQGQLFLKIEENKVNSNVNSVREYLKAWRKLPLDKRGVSLATQELLAHWHKGKISPRPFFCQLEAVETFIWLNEVAPLVAAKLNKAGKKIKDILQEIENVNSEFNMGLPRLGAKMATGSGKTVVMAMLIAYHAVNKARYFRREAYCNRFLIITPGLTVKDRLRVLNPRDPQNYYDSHNIVPGNMLSDVKKATVVITNYHAFSRRETRKITGRAREIMNGHNEKSIDTLESSGQMLNRVCRELLRGGSEDIVVINDEAHHCYIKRDHTEKNEKFADTDEKKEADYNAKAARVWMNGIKALEEKLGENKRVIKTIYDLSATPFFLKGSGYSEGAMFPWVVSDFSLIDAIESGIVKMPRVPVKDSSEHDLPVYRDLYKHIRAELPKRVSKNSAQLDPDKLPAKLYTAMHLLYESYEKTYEDWNRAGIEVPPVCIIVCNNTATSKAVYEYISGYERKNGQWQGGEFALFNNVREDDSGPIARPHTLLIDSRQTESGEGLSGEFLLAAESEIRMFKNDMRIRSPGKDPDNIKKGDLLREVMNTVGKKGMLGEKVRCVVSVSMLTEGWDASNVTHILGVRAFGTQLLCEQVVGRALRRISYEVEEGDDKFPPEYSVVLGVPFHFAPGKETGTPSKNNLTLTRVRHLPERAQLEITYPRVTGYRKKPPGMCITAKFDKNSRMVIDGKNVPHKTEVTSLGDKEDQYLMLDNLMKRRINEVAYQLAGYIIEEKYKGDEGGVSLEHFDDMLEIVRQWMNKYVDCINGAFIQYLLLRSYTRRAANIIYRACDVNEYKNDWILPTIDIFTREGTTLYVDFLTRKKKDKLHHTAPDKSHINIAVCDSSWEMRFCRVLDAAPDVLAYARNDGLGFTVPYAHEAEILSYEPDFIVYMDDGRGKRDPLKMVIEIKGNKDDRAWSKADTMEKQWIPAVNNHGGWGRWKFVEIMDPQHLDIDINIPQGMPFSALLEECAGVRREKYGQLELVNKEKRNPHAKT